MSTILKVCFSVFFISFSLVIGSSQTKFVNEFLNIGVGARAHGMFGAVAASSNDATAAYWNTAGLTELQSPFQVSAMHANWFGGLSNYDYISIAKKFNAEKKSVGALTVIRMAIDNIPNTLNLVQPDGSIDYDRVKEFSAADYGFLFSYARALSDDGSLSIGFNAKIIHRTIGDFGTAWGFGGDASLRWRKNNLAFAVTARDITTTVNAWSFSLSDEEKDVFAATGNDIPVSTSEVNLPRVILGGAYKTQFSDFSLLTELDINFSTNGTEAGVFSRDRFSADPAVGLEVGYLDKVFIRAGAGNFQRVINNINASEAEFEFQPNIGLGLVLGRLKVDYALANVGGSSGVLESHIFSLTLDFNSRRKSTEVN